MKREIYSQTGVVVFAANDERKLTLARQGIQSDEQTHAALELIDARWVRNFRRRIKPWFQNNARDLPWRNIDDPYRIWVSEIMLQQTQVATVIPFYDRFLKQFPNVKSLANADQSTVLRSWEGLGYYRRARQLHAAAQQIRDEHDGRFPQTFDEVLALPGIGRYTAGAILSFSADQQLPILEANTIRLYARLIGLKDIVEERASQNALWSFAELILPRRNCGDFNQSLMELGSTICTPQNPDCRKCPVASQCLANISGTQAAIPQKKPRRKFKEVQESMLVIRRRGKLLMRVCGKDEWWTGLWDFPRYRIAAGSAGRLREMCHEHTGLSVEFAQPAFTLRHTVTHHNIQLDCYVSTDVKGRLKRTAVGSASKNLNTSTGKLPSDYPGGLRWISPAELDALPLCVTGRKVAKQLKL